ncbi:hypothetical protein PIROE2DRAFT_16740 [Piromyces sp. E2]|nr:hypothetical protein PIROE2DRAFT_16740 [Piromyces sp. E2]|eukprot:OUM58075.1 hypothetical protein PIROE2DRAFT_16740 [Piromyces sp. E2]
MQELERKNNDMIEIEKTNKDKIERLEKKFFEEKVRLQNETNKKLAELASKAHEDKNKKGKTGKGKKEQKPDLKAEVERMRNPAMEKLYENASRENEQYKVRIENLIKTIDNLQETCRIQDHDADY